MSSPRNAAHVDYVTAFIHMCFTAAGLAIQAAASAAFKTVNTLSYTIDGVFYTKAATANIAFVANSLDPNTGLAMTAAAMTVPVGTAAYFGILIDAAGNIKIMPGIKSSPSNAVAAYTGTMPDYPRGYAQLGFIKVVTTTAAFVPGTTALDAAGLTVTFRDTSMGSLATAP